MLLKRYSNIDYIMSMDWETSFLLIKKAIEKEQEDLLIQRWIGSEYGFQSRMSLSKFKELCTPQKEYTTEEIMQKVNSIIEFTNEGGEEDRTI